MWAPNAHFAHSILTTKPITIFFIKVKYTHNELCSISKIKNPPPTSLSAANFFTSSIASVELDISTYYLVPLIAATSFNSFMAKKKHSRSSSSTDHELAIVKAAAWAWYQRGSGSEANPMSEFDVARTHRVVYKPSRYKLEAMKISEQEEEEEEADNDNISLLDSYEIESISKRFDQLINSNTATELLKNVSQNSETTNTRKKAAKKSRGFWLRHAVICGTRQDAVVDARLYGVSRRPEKRAPVVSSIYSSFHDSN